MKRIKLRNNFNRIVLTTTAIMAASAQADTQQGSSSMMGDSGMMGGHGMAWMGGYGGMWMPILLVALVAGIVAWIIARKKK